MVKNPRKPLHVEVSLFVHATEDPEKVLKAVKNIFPADYVEDIEFEKSELLGYYKNPITVLKVIIGDKVLAAAFLKNLLRRLEAQDRTLLSSELEEYTDSKGNLYMRLDKQDAFQGKIRLCYVDPIHVKIKLNFLPRTLDELESL